MDNLAREDYPLLLHRDPAPGEENESIRKRFRVLPSPTGTQPGYEKMDGDRPKPSGLQIRHVLTLLAFVGFMNVYALRVNLGVAIVAMVRRNHSTVDETASGAVDGQCPSRGNSSSGHSGSGEFDWNTETESLVLGAFFYGYIFTQLLGGYLAERFGPDRVFGYGIACTAVLTLLTPVAARLSVWFLIALRFAEGFGEGVTYPAMHVFWSRWAPLQERSRLVAISYAGAQFGTVFAVPASGYLAAEYGWPSVFYVMGSICVVWCGLWLYLAADSPANHPLIKADEAAYIIDNTGRLEPGGVRPPIPWRRFFRTPAVVAICIAHFGNNWGLYTYLTELPSYMANVLKFSLRANGLVSALPYVGQWSTMILSGIIADKMRQRGFGNTRIRRALNTIGLWLPALFLLLVPQAGCSPFWAVLFLSLALGCSGIAQGGYMVNHIDVAPEFSGILMGLSNTLATVPGFAAPAVVGFMVGEPDEQTIDQWRRFFYLTAGIYFASGLFYLTFALGERLPWLDEYMYAHGVTNRQRDTDDDADATNAESGPQLDTRGAVGAPQAVQPQH